MRRMRCEVSGRGTPNEASPTGKLYTGNMDYERPLGQGEIIMGVFHCPIDAAGTGMAGCCNCGLCTASTAAERQEAASRMRAYIRANTEEKTTSAIRKICVCGKGGTGKSTITSLFAIALADNNYQVLVIDTDESNPSLYRKLALPREPKPLIQLLERFAVGDGDGHIPDDSWLKQDGLTVDKIPAEYIVRSGNIMLLESGKVTDPLQGCACNMADLTREIMQNMKLTDREIIIADLEAGVESFGRGLEQGADTIIAMVEPSFDSIQLTEKIQYMAQGIGISRVRAIMNKIPSPKVEKEIRSMLIDTGIRFLGAFSMSDKIASASLQGIPILNGAEYDHAKLLVRLMLDEAGMD